MINTLFLASSLIPIGLGMGFLWKPRYMNKIQLQLRRRLAHLQKKFYQEHRMVGLCFMIWGLFMVYTYYQPLWIYRAFVASRMVIGVFFPDAVPALQQAQPVDVTSTIWL